MAIIKRVLIFLFSITKLCGQTAFLDSVFYNIPFHKDIRTTNRLLSEDKDFHFYAADTMSSAGHSYIAYTTSLSHIIPTASTRIKLEKHTMNVVVDGKRPAHCISYATGVEFTYRSESAAIKAISKIVKELEKKLKPKEIAGLRNAKKEKYGQELYLGETRHCNYVIVTHGQYNDTNYVHIRYH